MNYKMQALFACAFGAGDKDSGFGSVGKMFEMY